MFHGGGHEILLLHVAFFAAFCGKIRVKPASKSSAGKTLSREDVPEDEWKKFGLEPPMPEVRPS